jgi:magnesium chelatase family protein
MLANALSASIVGVDGVPVRVEVDVSFGLPGLTIVGLAGSAVLEARERVRAALRNSGFEVPARRITVNLAPADLPKEGTGHDLAMAAAILVASGQLEADLGRVALIGELALDGSLRPIPGAMALVAAARGSGIVEAIVPIENGPESAAVGGVDVLPAACFSQVVRHLAGQAPLERLERVATSPGPPAREDAPDLASVIGQTVGRRALEIAVAGRHNLAFVGPPGVGKTLLARAGAGLLPPLAEDEAAEVSRIHSVAGVADPHVLISAWPPFRAPHHTISMQALVGGGPRVRPGEASLAHRGVLFLDETLQFRTDALDALRGPIDAGTVLIARVDGILALPARFMLLAAFNPCPCLVRRRPPRVPLRGRRATALSGAAVRTDARPARPCHPPRTERSLVRAWSCRDDRDRRRPGRGGDRCAARSAGSVECRARAGRSDGRARLRRTAPRPARAAWQADGTLIATAAPRRPRGPYDRGPRWQ